MILKGEASVKAFLQNPDALLPPQTIEHFERVNGRWQPRAHPSAQAFFTAYFATAQRLLDTFVSKDRPLDLLCPDPLTHVFDWNDLDCKHRLHDERGLELTLQQFGGGLQKPLNEREQIMQSIFRGFGERRLPATASPRRQQQLNVPVAPKQRPITANAKTQTNPVMANTGTQTNNSINFNNNQSEASYTSGISINNQRINELVNAISKTQQTNGTNAAAGGIQTANSPFPSARPVSSTRRLPGQSISMSVPAAPAQQGASQGANGPSSYELSSNKFENTLSSNQSNYFSNDEDEMQIGSPRVGQSAYWLNQPNGSPALYSSRPPSRPSMNIQALRRALDNTPGTEVAREMIAQPDIPLDQGSTNSESTWQTSTGRQSSRRSSTNNPTRAATSQQGLSFFEQLGQFLREGPSVQDNVQQKSNDGSNIVSKNGSEYSEYTGPDPRNQIT